jgi:hypothetical protein
MLTDELTDEQLEVAARVAETWDTREFGPCVRTYMKNGANENISCSKQSLLEYG